MKKPEKHVERMLAAARLALDMARLAARIVEARRLADARRASRPPRGKKPPRAEGGEPVPAIPRPRPKPLAGGAAAPLPKSKRRGKAGVDRRARLLDIPAETGSGPSGVNFAR
jgi:hypothetical protein